MWDNYSVPHPTLRGGLSAAALGSATTFSLALSGTLVMLHALGTGCQIGLWFYIRGAFSALWVALLVLHCLLVGTVGVCVHTSLLPES